MNETPFLLIEQRAEFGEPFAQVLFGFLLEHGLHMTPDRTAAKKWYERAAKQGFAPGQFALAALQSEHEPDLAVKLLTEVAESGYPPAQYELASTYYGGRIVKQDYNLAFRWAKAAAEQGFTPALMFVALLYSKGRGVEADPQLEMDYLRQAAEKGDPSAANSLGTYLIEQGGKTQISEGLKWIWKAAEKDDFYANFYLSEIYRDGLHGVKKDKTLSKFFLSRSEINISKH